MTGKHSNEVWDRERKREREQNLYATSAKRKDVNEMGAQ